MAGNYEKGMYNQLMDVMSRLDSFEKKYHHDTTQLKEEISTLKIENQHLPSSINRSERHETLQYLQRKRDNKP